MAKSISKRLNSYKNMKVRNLLNAIKQKPGNPISQISQWIKNILANE